MVLALMHRYGKNVIVLVSYMNSGGIPIQKYSESIGRNFFFFFFYFDTARICVGHVRDMVSTNRIREKG